MKNKENKSDDVKKLNRIKNILRIYLFMGLILEILTSYEFFLQIPEGSTLSNVYAATLSLLNWGYLIGTGMLLLSNKVIHGFVLALLGPMGGLSSLSFIHQDMLRLLDSTICTFILIHALIGLREKSPVENI